MFEISDYLVSNLPGKHNPRSYQNRLFRPIKGHSERTGMGGKALQRTHESSVVDNNVRFGLYAGCRTNVVVPIVIT